MTIFSWLGKLFSGHQTAGADSENDDEMQEKFAHIRKMCREFQKNRAGSAPAADDAKPVAAATAASAAGGESTPQQDRRFSRRVDPASDTHQLAAILEALARENRMYMAEYTEVMRMERDFNSRLAKRTSNIIRISVFALVVLSTAMIMLIYSLTSNLSEVTKNTQEMTREMMNMRQEVSSMTRDVNGIHGQLGHVTHNFEEMNRQVWVMNGQMNTMKRDVNTMSSPMRMMPFRP